MKLPCRPILIIICENWDAEKFSDVPKVNSHLVEVNLESPSPFSLSSALPCIPHTTPLYSLIIWLIWINTLKSFCRNLTQPVAEGENNFLFGLGHMVIGSWNKKTKKFSLQTKITASWNTPPGGGGKYSSLDTLLTPWWAHYSHELNLHATLPGGCCHEPHFTDKKTEVSAD